MKDRSLSERSDELRMKINKRRQRYVLLKNNLMSQERHKGMIG